MQAFDHGLDVELEAPTLDVVGGDRPEAIEIVQKINLPGYFPTHYTAAMIHAQLGNMPAARTARDRTLQLWPDFERDFTDQMQKWIRNQPDLIAHILEGVRLAGFHI